MKRFLLIILFIAVGVLSSFSNSYTGPFNASADKAVYIASKFNINSNAVEMALRGYEKLKQLGKLTNQRYLSIADFSKPSNEERLFIIDMQMMELVLKTWVAHGRNSGTKFADKFSNTISSYQSSLGFYVTGNPYKGKHGNSLELNGVEQGINDKARQRAIVIHGANYVSPDFIKQQGYIGRSQGCPAVPNNKVATIIKAIQGASCLFVYAPNTQYLKQSEFIR